MSENNAYAKAELEALEIRKREYAAWRAYIEAEYPNIESARKEWLDTLRRRWAIEQRGPAGEAL